MSLGMRNLTCKRRKVGLGEGVRRRRERRTYLFCKRNNAEWTLVWEKPLESWKGRNGIGGPAEPSGTCEQLLCDVDVPWHLWDDRPALLHAHGLQHLQLSAPWYSLRTGVPGNGSVIKPIVGGWERTELFPCVQAEMPVLGCGCLSHRGCSRS